MFAYRAIFLIIFSLYIHNLNAWAQTPVLQQADDGKATGPVVEMEPYIVRGRRILPKPESWLYMKVPAITIKENGGESTQVHGYEILYSGDKQDAILFAGELQLRQVASLLLFPTFTRMLPMQDVVIVRNEDYPQLRRLLLKPGEGLWDNPYRDEDTGVDGESSPLPPVQKINLRAYNILVANRHRGPLVIYNEAIRMPGRRGNKPLDMKEVREYQRGATQEASVIWARINGYFSNQTAVWSEKTSPWFSLGVGILMSQFDANLNGYSFRRINRYRRNKWDLPRSLADLLEVELPKSMWRRQETASYLAFFAHFGLFGQNGANREKFMALAQKMDGKPFSEELFQEVWGKSSSQVLRELQAHILAFDADPATEYRGKMPELPPVSLREVATQSQVARLKAELFISFRQITNALDELRIAYWRGEREPAMLGLLALLEQRIGSEERAQRILKTLMALPVPPPHAYIAAARFRFKELLAAKPPGEKLSAAESSELIAMLSGALAGGLTTEELCGALAEVVLKSAEPPDANITEFLAEAAKRYPLNQAIAAALKTGNPQPYEPPESADKVRPCFLQSIESTPASSNIVNPTREKTNEPKKNETR